jgi:hypothetical protein
VITSYKLEYCVRDSPLPAQVFFQPARTRHASLSLYKLLFSSAITFEDPLFGL